MLSLSVNFWFIPVLNCQINIGYKIPMPYPQIMVGILTRLNTKVEKEKHLIKRYKRQLPSLNRISWSADNLSARSTQTSIRLRYSFVSPSRLIGRLRYRVFWRFIRIFMLFSLAQARLEAWKFGDRGNFWLFGFGKY